MTPEEFISKLGEKGKAKKTSSGWQCCCPAHEDGTASLSVGEGKDGGTVIHCHAGCTPESICASLGIALADLFVPKEPRNGGKIAATYDYHDRAGKLLFQVVRFDPKDFRQRKPDSTALDGWAWSTKGVEKVLFRLPEILKDIEAGKFVFLCEGEKDVLKMVEHGFSATCNPGGAGKWQDNYSDSLRGAAVVIVPDKDAPGRAHAALVASKLGGIAKFVRVIELPDIGDRATKDAFDFFTAGGDAAQIGALVDSAPEVKPASLSRLTLRTPGEILAMTFDDSDKILGDRLLARGQPLVIAGAGGTGKSRFWLQGIAAIVTGRKFLAFETGGSAMRWLVLQTENSNRRLQKDLAAIKNWLGDDWPKFNDQVTLHTLENDDDGFVTVDSVENQLAIQLAIEDTRPDGIVIDPLNDFGIGDLNKDADMKLTCQTLSRLCRRGNPDRVLVALHHSLTGKAGVQRVSGFDRSSFARNSKALFAWTRGQINLAPIDPDSNDRLAVVCGKCSNGPEFQAFAIALNLETLIYECDPSVDINLWSAELSGAKAEPLMSLERVAELCQPLMARTKLAKAVADDCGCSKATAYRHIAKATGLTICLNAETTQYSRK